MSAELAGEPGMNPGYTGDSNMSSGPNGEPGMSSGLAGESDMNPGYTGDTNMSSGPDGEPGIILELADILYRLALSLASQRDLSGAVRLSRYACQLNKNHEKAIKLLEICLHELGNLNPESDESYEQIRIPVKQKKWRKAISHAKSTPHRSVRILNIQGCIYACAKRYKKAAQAFSEALEKDKHNKTATSGLAEVIKHRSVICAL